MSRTTECYEKVSALFDKVDDMTGWEYDFVNNVADYEEQGRLFSAAQMEKIEELHEQYCE